MFRVAENQSESSLTLLAAAVSYRWQGQFLAGVVDCEESPTVQAITTFRSARTLVEA